MYILRQVLQPGDVAGLNIQLGILQRRRDVVGFRLEAGGLVEALLEGRVKNRELGVVGLVDRVVGEGIVKIHRRELVPRTELGGFINVPHVLGADQIVAIGKIAVAAQRPHRINMGFAIKDAVGLGFVGTTEDHQGMIIGSKQRHGDIAVHFAGLEGTAIDTDLTLDRLTRVGLLVEHVDHTQAAVATVVEALATAVNFNRLDHPRVQGGRAPDGFQRCAAVKGGHTVQQQQGIPVGATVDADGEFPFIR